MTVYSDKLPPQIGAGRRPKYKKKVHEILTKYSKYSKKKKGLLDD